MGRGATKAAGNVYYKARIEAAKWNDRLCSREGAAEALGVSVDTVKNIELGLHKCVPVDLVVLMSDLYNLRQVRTRERDGVGVCAVAERGQSAGVPGRWLFCAYVPIVYQTQVPESKAA